MNGRILSSSEKREVLKVELQKVRERVKQK